MELIDLLHIGVRWGHALAAIVWVGGSLFYLLTLNPALALLGDFPEQRALLDHIGRQFQEVVRLAIRIFVLTGVVLTVDAPLLGRRERDLHREPFGRLRPDREYPLRHG